jgi:hypothetical protein
MTMAMCLASRGTGGGRVRTGGVDVGHRNAVFPRAERRTDDARPSHPVRVTAPISGLLMITGMSQRGGEGSNSAEDDEGPGSDARLTKLEAADDRRREGQRLDRKFELTEAILLSIAAVLAAWTGFQAAKWSGVQANSYSAAGASRVEAVRAATLAGQESLADVVTFTQWLAAGEEEGLFDEETLEGQTYVPDPDLLSGFLYQRFRPEFKVAADAWVSTEPRRNPDAPPTPFVMPEYQLSSLAEAHRLEQQADAFAAEARDANQRSDNYVLTTIMFATVLFFAGISSKMDTPRARGFLLGTGISVLVVSAAVVLSFPKEL